MSDKLAISNLDGLGEPQRQNLFDVIITPPNAASITFKDWSLYIKSISTPETSGDGLDIQWRGHKVRYDGQEGGGGEVSVSFWDTEALLVYTALEAWRKISRNIKTGVSVGKTGDMNYLGAMSIISLSTEGSNLGIWLLHNVSCAGLPSLGFDSSSSDVISYDISFRYDWWEFQSPSGS